MNLEAPPPNLFSRRRDTAQSAAISCKTNEPFAGSIMDVLRLVSAPWRQHAAISHSSFSLAIRAGFCDWSRRKRFAQEAHKASRMPASLPYTSAQRTLLHQTSLNFVIEGPSNGRSQGTIDRRSQWQCFERKALALTDCLFCVMAQLTKLNNRT
ncbi:hypothetical protein BDW62DRAFT_174631 [Aspergillus aurantiobrunneus]